MYASKSSTNKEEQKNLKLTYVGKCAVYDFGFELVIVAIQSHLAQVLEVQGLESLSRELLVINIATTLMDALLNVYEIYEPIREHNRNALTQD